MKELKDSEDELEQYCRGLCVKIDGVPMTEKKISSDVLQNVISITEEFSSEIPGIVIDRAELIGKCYSDETSWAKCKSIIVRFTKKHYSIFTEAIE